MALRLGPSFSHPLIASSDSVKTTRQTQVRRCSIRSCILEPNESRKLVLEVKEKLDKEHPSLPVGRNGRDDEYMILWFLQDRRFSVEEAVAKLTKAIAFDPSDDEKLCVFLIERALGRLSTGKEQILGLVDLRGFRKENADLKFLTFLFDVFYYYYPKRVAQVLFVDAPFVFKPIWQMVKPLLKSYASLMKFCSAETVKKEYFTPETLPASFRD